MSRSPLSRAIVAVLFACLLGGVVWFDHRARASATLTGETDFGFRLREVAAERGIEFVHRPTTLDPRLANVAPHVSAMGAAVALCDFDRDGWVDIYATTSRFGASNALYKNLGNGKFRDVAPEVGLAALNVEGQGVTMGALWGDYDNDGFEDCVLYKWGFQQLLRNRGDGSFEDVSEASGVRRWMNSNSAVWLDYDRDGWLDLYIAGYFDEAHDLWNLKSTRIMQESFEFANNGGRNYLLRNERGHFVDVTEATGCDSRRWTLAVASVDMNGDAWPDLYLANDYGPEELFLNLEGRRFEKQSGVGLEESSKSGMSVTLGDFENAGRFGVYVTNISAEGFLFQGNNLRINRLAEKRKLFNIADGSSRAIVDCGWAWGAQFGDLNNDGWLDLYVTNGFISASKERDYWYGMTKVAGGASEIFIDATQWEPIGDASLSGYERSRVLLGYASANEQGQQQFRGFKDVGLAVGVDDLLDGRAVALGDFQNRGCLDVVVANQNAALLLYENEVDPTRHWIKLDLRGSRGNPSAIGAEVRLRAGEFQQVQAVQGGSGFCAQNDRRLHFGLGEIARVDQLVIRWPSGHEQVLDNPAVNRIHVVEEPAP